MLNKIVMAKEVNCGSLVLSLAGVPADHPFNLILALISQYHLITNDYTKALPDMISQFVAELDNFKASLEIVHQNETEKLQSICNLYNIAVCLYANDKINKINPFPSTGIPPLVLHLYQTGDVYDSVISSRPYVAANYPITYSISCKDLPDRIKLSTWNLNGVTDDVKRVMVDYELNRDKIVIAAIQESHLWCSRLETKNYIWVLGPQYQSRAWRGLGFLISKSIYSYVSKVEFLTYNIGCLTFQLPTMSKPFIFINVHKHNNGSLESPIETGLLSSIIRDKQHNAELICAGDLNARFGSSDALVRDSIYFGKELLHEESNSNGEDIALMCQMLELKVITTMYDRSTKLTWTRKGVCSQLDHILVPQASRYRVMNLHANWSKVPSDHKRITWKIKFYDVKNAMFKKVYPKSEIYRFKSWDLSALMLPNTREKFNNNIEKSLIDARAELLNLTWSDVSSIVCFCAEKLLKRRIGDYSEDERFAFHNFNLLLTNVMKRRVVDIDPSELTDNTDYPPSLPLGSITKLRSAYKQMKRARQSKPQQLLLAFLNNLEQNVSSPGERVQSAMQFIKSSKRAQFCSNAVTIKDWEEELKLSEGSSVPLMEENDLCPLLPPPKFEDVEFILHAMKNNKTPGLDNLPVEFYKSSPVLRRELYKFITHAYITNEVPMEWQETYSIPIPKKKNPQNVNDHRKLTMCQISYKVYAIILKNMLSRYLPSMDFYQSGFIANRSCDDLSFTLKNILDVRWNHNLPSFVFSLDLRKAFDTVEISKLPEILQSHDVPICLINRIIAIVLTEKNRIFWQGQYSQSHVKGKGIKQGCPFSPELFVIILDAALQKTKRDLINLGIHLTTGSHDESTMITLPMIVAYADDIYLLSDVLSQGVLVMEVLLNNLKFYGLELNSTKSGLLIKSPDFTPPTSVQVLNMDIPVVASIKVLGTTINSHMKRKAVIKSRVDNSMRVFYALSKYLKELKLSMALLMRLYEIIIVPALIYGLNSSSMTQQNRSTLMRREILILKNLSTIAHPRPPQVSIAKLLNNHTINRKVSIRRLRYYMHVRRGSEHSLTTKSLCYRVNSRRKVGRPIFTFNQTLFEDMKKFETLGLSESDWEDLYPFRDIVKKVTAELLNKSDLSDDPLPFDLNLYGEYELMQQS